MSIEYFSPADIVSKSPKIAVDLETAFLNYQADNKRFGVDGQVKIGKKSIKAVIKGETTSDGVEPYSWKMKTPDGEKSGTSYSITVELSEEDVDAFDALTTILENFLGDHEGFEEWTVKAPLQGDKLKVKLKLEDKKIAARFNGKRIEARKYDDLGLEDGQTLTIYGTFEPSFRFKEQRAELNFVPRKFIYTPVEDEAPKKKVKKD